MLKFKNSTNQAENVIEELKSAISNGSGHNIDKTDVLELTDIVTEENEDIEDLESHQYMLGKINNTMEGLDNMNQKVTKNYMDDVKNSIKTLKDNKKNANTTSVEDLIRDIATPYIEQWLEKNLHSIVKKEVEKAIKDISQD